MVPVLELGPLAGCVGGIAVFAYALSEITRAALATRWPTVEGEIAGTRLVHRMDEEGDSTDYDYVAYRYQVDGRPYRNDRIRFGPVVAPSSIIPTVDPPPNNPRAAAELARRYPTGQRVRVRYNPRDPRESVLYAEASPTIWIMLVAGAALGFLGAWLLF